MKKILLLGAMFMAFVSLSNAQIKTPPASPLCKINQEVGLIKVDVEYSRPSAKGRRIFGELVPFGQMWRTGANASTKITLSDDAMIGGVAVKKGTYAIYATPAEKDWTIIIYKNTEFWGVQRGRCGCQIHFFRLRAARLCGNSYPHFRQPAQQRR
jgi:hypothetical protein